MNPGAASHPVAPYQAFTRPQKQTNGLKGTKRRKFSSILFLSSFYHFYVVFQECPSCTMTQGIDQTPKRVTNFGDATEISRATARPRSALAQTHPSKGPSALTDKRHPLQPTARGQGFLRNLLTLSDRARPGFTKSLCCTNSRRQDSIKKF